MSAYTPDARSKAGRLPKRMHYDQDLVHGILNEVQILHVSFNAPPQDDMPQFPSILPMLGYVGTYKDDEDPHIYLHGSSVARMFKLTNGGEMPVTIAGTLIDGYVLALAPFHNSCNYRSAVAFGHGSLLDHATQADEINFALTNITNSAIPERWENSRSEATKAELTSTAILKVRIETASAKVRAGGPSDDRSDMKNDELTAKTWVGVVPSYTVLGDPIEGAHNKVKNVPEYLSDWVADKNSLNEQKAVNAVDEE